MRKQLYLRVTAQLEDDHTFISLTYEDGLTFDILMERIRIPLRTVDMTNMPNHLLGFSAFEGLRVNWGNLFVSKDSMIRIILHKRPQDRYMRLTSSVMLIWSL